MPSRQFPGQESGDLFISSRSLPPNDSTTEQLKPVHTLSLPTPGNPSHHHLHLGDWTAPECPDLPLSSQSHRGPLTHTDHANPCLHLSAHLHCVTPTMVFETPVDSSPLSFLTLPCQGAMAAALQNPHSQAFPTSDLTQTLPLEDPFALQVSRKFQPTEKLRRSARASSVRPS